MCKFAVLVGLFWLGVIVLQAGTRYVSLDGTNDVDNGYTNWAGAATEIQWAVSVATNGETVLVSNGTYNLTNQVNIFSNITVRSFSEQGHGTNDTFVNGNNYAGKLVTNRCFYMTNGVLNGFAITNGYAANSGGGLYIINAGVYNCFICKNSTDSSGGGIYSDSRGVVSNCTIISNNALLSWGGGIYCYNNSKIYASYISGNRAYYAGGVRLYLNCTMTNCTIVDNLATNYGGMYLNYSDARNCLISNNVARLDCGGVWVDISPNYLYDSIIISNRAYRNYGGLVVNYGGTVSGCRIIGNRGGNGAGALVDGNLGASVLANCLVRENVIDGGNGGGIQHADGTARNCLIVSNTGEGVYSKLGSAARTYTSVVENCTIAGNSAGGLYLYTASNSIRSCIVYSNTTYDMKFGDTAGSNNCWNNCATNLFLANQGNITNNPSFVDWANGNYHLRDDSPCINAGITQSWMATSYDLDGRTRIRYGRVDMGAYEIIISGTIYGFR